MGRSLDSACRKHKSGSQTGGRNVNKAYRTLLAGVLSILFMGSALGCAPGDGTMGGAGPDVRRADPATACTLAGRYTGNERTEGMPR